VAVINPLVEGDIDEAVAIRLIQHAGHHSGVTYGRRGFGYIKDKIDGFNRSATEIQYLTLVDFMDTGLACPPTVVANWLPHPRPGMTLRVVVREIESWLLADREGLTDFLAVRPTLLNINPETVPDPKQALVNIARRSRSRNIREAIVPSPPSTAPVGSRYNAELRAFARDHWNPTRARANAPSLASCMDRLAAIPV
jgi:hypothetical protein